jgi:hypothetical protein
MEPSPAQRAARDQIAAQLAQAGFALPGTLTVRAYACGKPGCRCHADPPRLHGPYAEWTRKIGGKTITRRLTPAELAEYQPLFDNAKKLRTLLSELQDLTLQIIETGSTREPSTPAEPEPHTPENVGEARLTCGQPSSQTPFAQASPKREDHTTWEASHQPSHLRRHATERGLDDICNGSCKGLSPAETLACGKLRRSRSAGREENYGRPRTVLPAAQTA